MDEQNFKMSVFGGFSKKSVVDYVTKIIDDFNLEIDNLKKDYERQLEEKDEQISSLSSKLKSQDSDYEILKSKLSELENNKSINDESNLKKLEEKEAIIAKMTEEIEQLKAGTVHIQNKNKALENKVNEAKDAVKERFNKMIEQARVKIAEEYRKNLEKSDEESRAVRNRVAKEASQILNNSADAAQSIISESKDKINKFIEQAKEEAKAMLEFASVVGQNIVKKSVDEIFSKHRNSVIENLNSKISLVDDLNFETEIDDELFNAVKKLNADLAMDEKKPSVDSDATMSGEITTDKKNAQGCSKMDVQKA